MPNPIVLEWPVRTAIRSMGPSELESFNRAMDRLRNGELQDDPRPYPINNPAAPATYIVNVDDSIRIMFQLQADQIFVQDMTRQEFADSMLRKTRAEMAT